MYLGFVAASLPASNTLLTAPGDLVRYAVGAVDPASCTDERFPGPNSGGTNFCAEQVELW